VTPEFFKTAGITFLQGETFASSYAADSEPVAIVSESFARRFWPKGDAVGKRYKPGKTEVQAPWIRIIGVVAETKYRGLVANPTRDPDTYGSFDQRPTYGFSIVVHTKAESRSIGQSLRHLITSLDPNIPVFAVVAIEERIARASSNQRFSAQLMGAFAVAALLLAAVGLYGVVSFSVGQRTQEIGVRMALGARPADILRMVLGQTGRLLAVGVIAGAALAVMLTRFIESMLFNVSARDPLAYAALAVALALEGLFAAWWPARRAAKVDPMAALRTE
jgi:putative ABC transport system permease protein